ncbi:hypothetical protein [Streptomyces sp. NPDC055099]
MGAITSAASGNGREDQSPYRWPGVLAGLEARAGVPHFWRVEQDEEKGLPVVYVFEFDPATRSCGLIGIFHDRLKLSSPFDVEIDLAAVNRRPGLPLP